MKTTRLYIVSVESNGKTSISQEAYWSYSDAEKFIMNRSDKPKMVSVFRFESKENIYCIHDVFAYGNR